MRISVLPVVVALSGCVAANPDSIKPMSISTVGYDALDCPALAAEDQRVADRLFRLEFDQRHKRRGDLFTAAAVGLTPTGMGAGDNAAEIGRLKGERQTIATVKGSKACPEPAAVVDEKRMLREMAKERYAATTPS